MSDLTPELAKNLNIYQDMQLIGLSLNEMRFMIYVISTIRERGLQRDDIDELLSFHVSGFEAVYGVSAADSRRVYSRVAESFDALTGNPYAWIDYIELNRGVISLMLATKVKDLIFDEKKPLFNFPIYEIIDIHSSIALRFFDFISKNKLENSEFYLSTDDVRTICLAYGDSYKSDSNVRSKLVNHSIELINESTSMLLTVGRRTKNTAGDFRFNSIMNKAVNY